MIFDFSFSLCVPGLLTQLPIDLSLALCAICEAESTIEIYLDRHKH
jgi:hypothetical protein